MRFRALLRPAFLYLALAAGIAATGCKRQVRAVPAPVPVRVAQVAVRDVAVTRQAVGVVQPLHSVAILSQVEGVLMAVHFREGDDVKAGDLLVTLDQRPFQAALQAAEAQVAQARANRDKAQADLDRYARLREQQAVSEADYSQYAASAATTRAAVAVQEAAVATAKLNLNYTEIRAPISGRTGRLALREGSLVRANDASQPLVTINQLAPVGVSFSLPESDLALVQKAFAAGPVAVRARPATGPGPALEGKLDYIDNTVGLDTGTIALRAEFANEGRTLWPGQFAEVTLRLGEVRGALVVPATAVVAGQQGDQVFIVKPDQTIEVRAIHAGLVEGEVVAIDRVQAGETVVTDGQIRLVNGTRITVAKPEPPAAGETKNPGRKPSP